jgi:hypothetical protein
MEIKKKKCKACTGLYTPRASTQQACSPICAIAWNKAKEAKKADREQNKEHRLKRKIFKASDLKTRKIAAKIACHRYIRERDKNQTCICCGRKLGDKFDAGHFLESGNNPQIRFDEDNIHAQSVYCNQYKGGDSDDYRGNLIKKIGLERVERLENMKGGAVKRSAEDYKQIESYYKDKLKALIEQ